MKLLLCLMVSIVFALNGLAHPVSGIVLLSGSESHAGTTIEFAPLSPSATHVSAMSDINGAYLLDATPGLYRITFTHSGFHTDTLALFVVTSDSTIPLVTLFALEGLSGNLSGELGPGVFEVNGDLTVPDGETLTIHAGTTLLFVEYARLYVHGRLHAGGNAQDSIYFTAPSGETSSNWQGIYCTTALNSEFDYCVIENVGPEIPGTAWPVAPLYSSGHVRVSNCMFRFNRAACSCIRLHGSALIKRSVFVDNIAQSQGLIKQYNASNLEMDHCSFARNTAIPFDMPLMQISGELVIRNSILCEGDGLYFMTIVNPEIDVRYSLFCSPADFSDTGGLPPLFGEMITTNANGDSTDTYYNLFIDPLFVDAEHGNFHLLPGSPCIDAGDPTGEHDPDGSIADLGAYPFEALNLTPGREGPMPVEIALYPNYPNPFNATTTIPFELAAAGRVQLTIYDISGRFVTELLDEHLNVGANRIEFNAAGLSSGVYFCTLQQGSQTKTNKLVFIK